jgi:hypothetical protein
MCRSFWFLRLFYPPTYLTTWNRAVLNKLEVAQIVKKLLTSYETGCFITTFTRTRHRSLFWAVWIHSTTSNRIFLRNILILSYHLPLCSRMTYSLQAYQLKFCTQFSSLKRATCSAHLTLPALKLLSVFKVKYNLWSYSLYCSEAFWPVIYTLSLLGPNILLSILFVCTQAPSKQ